MASAPEDPDDAARSDPAIPDEPDISAPLFFVSHANVNSTGAVGRTAQPDRAFLDFFHDLSVNVNHLHYRRSGVDPGFMDLTMRSGRDWEAEILEAVSTCQVFLALLSNPFPKSPWCGREWHAFTKRRCWNRTKQEWTKANGCVIPVVWAMPLRDAAMPPVVKAAERFIPAPLSDPSTATLYQERGIFGLRNTNHDAYNAAIWWLAREIEDTLQEYWVEPVVPPEYDELTDLFGAEEA